MKAKTLRIAVAGAGVIVATFIASSCIATAAPPKEDLPPEKQALVDSAEAHQNAGQPGDKSKDRGGPLVIQVDPPPRTGLLGAVAAPVPGTIFTAVNAWAGWVDPTTFSQVYAGSPAEDRGKGLLFVIRRPGANGLLEPGAEPEVKILPAPIAGGPLKIVRVEGDRLILANPGGQEMTFNPATGTFD